ncbi:MAG: phosphoglucosamine mutase [Candidatus Pacebacteria bacterium]|nr:phosphoglucosamine mutase [Candidatus Paceibacterota bacterium]
MALIASISGIRGTLGDASGLNPETILSYVFALGVYLKEKYKDQGVTLAIARDGRASGETISKLVTSTFNFLGIDTIDIGAVPTPTAGIFVKHRHLQGAVVITASHNPDNWNGLKFLNEEGEFLSPKAIEKVYSLANNKSYTEFLVKEQSLGKNNLDDTALNIHIERILSLDKVLKEAITKKNLKVVVDGINSVGGPAIEALLKELGVKNIICINKEMGQGFGHNPEPLESNLEKLKKVVVDNNCDLGIAVDPDGDRLALVCENGEFFGEENTLIAAAKYVLEHSNKQVAVSNLSSSLGLKDVVEKLGGQYFSAKVGEINVVEKMKAVKAEIGGEGNGGVIYPPSHYMRDSLVGLALILSYFSSSSFNNFSTLKTSLPYYVMIKERLDIDKEKLLEVFKVLKSEFEEVETNEEDGLKLLWSDKWVHLRPSNTEPICRVYIEAKTAKEANSFLEMIKNKINNL